MRVRPLALLLLLKTHWHSQFNSKITDYTCRWQRTVHVANHCARATKLVQNGVGLPCKLWTAAHVFSLKILGQKIDVKCVFFFFFVFTVMLFSIHLLHASCSLSSFSFIVLLYIVVSAEISTVVSFIVLAVQWKTCTLHTKRVSCLDASHLVH